MVRFFRLALVFITLLHGLIHLMGFVAYWPLAVLPDLPYKTALLEGRLEIGAGGMQVFSLLWLLAGVGFAAAAVSLAARRSYWAPLMLTAALLSLVLCILDGSVAALGVAINVALLLALGVVFGLRGRPTPFPAYTSPAGPVETVPLPAGLPAVVENFYHQTYDDRIPVYRSAVLTGRGTLRFMGIVMPARMRFIHVAGQEYRHYIETTFYNRPVFKVNETYLGGHSRLELPFGVVENDLKVDSAANLGLWGEMGAYPSIFVTDPRTRWQAVDESTARLFIPFGKGEQEFTVKFDPQAGLITHMEALRYLDEKHGVLRWWGDNSRRGGRLHWEVTWEHEGTPWLTMDLEEIVYNSDVSAYLRQRGI